jgi:gliding motility-associated-like protein
VLQTEVVCNVAYVGTSAVVFKHQVAPFCDSLVTITQRVFDICGCLQDSTQLYTGLIPNDGDNQNDYFIIPLLEQYTPNELVITDKRGMLVYRTLNYKNDWGGTNQNGEPLPQGVYNFVFRTATSNCLRRGVIDIKYIP